MRGTYARALAPGTTKNRINQATTYLKFMLAYKFDHFNPSTAELAMFSQFLANTYASPATVKNYLSGAKTWLLLHGGAIQSFGSAELGMMTKSITDNSQHVPSPAAPLTPSDIKIICNYIDSTQGIPLAVKPTILIAYSCFLRVSNVLAPTPTSWGGRHTLLAKDILDGGNSLYVIIRSTKTRRSGSPHVLLVMPTNNGTVCPVTAWKTYAARIDPCPIGPAFMINNSMPLSPSIVVPIIRIALHKAGKKDPKRFSFHSLRRGAAQAASEGGAPQEDIKYHGTWKSDNGVSHYLKTKPRIVPSIIATTLAQ